MYFAQPIKAHVIDQSLNESIAMSYYLITPINHHQLNGLISFHNYNGQSKAKYKLHHQYVQCLQYKNSKSSRQKLHFFKCEYLSFYTVYELEILRIYCYSPGLSFDQIENLTKNLVRRPLTF